MRSGFIPTEPIISDAENELKEAKGVFSDLMYLKAAALLVEPTEKQLGRAYVGLFSVQTYRHTGRNMQVQKIESFQYTPLRETMQKFLQQPGLMSSISQKEKLHDGRGAGEMTMGKDSNGVRGICFGVKC